MAKHVRIVITKHTRERIAERLPKSFDLLAYTPTCLWGEQDRRVWRDADGNTVLVVEKRDGDRLTLFIVTALAPGMAVVGGTVWLPDAPPVLARLADGTIVECPNVADRWAAIDPTVRESIQSRLATELRLTPGRFSETYAEAVGVDADLAAHAGVRPVAGVRRWPSRRASRGSLAAAREPPEESLPSRTGRVRMSSILPALALARCNAIAMTLCAATHVIITGTPPERDRGLALLGRLQQDARAAVTQAIASLVATDVGPDEALAVRETIATLETHLAMLGSLHGGRESPS